MKTSKYTVSKENKLNIKEEGWNFTSKIWTSIVVFKLRESEENSEKFIQIIGTRLEIWSWVLQTTK